MPNRTVTVGGVAVSMGPSAWKSAALAESDTETDVTPFANLGVEIGGLRATVDKLLDGS